MHTWIVERREPTGLVFLVLLRARRCRKRSAQDILVMYTAGIREKTKY